MRRYRVCVVLFVGLALFSAPAAAQNWSFDARDIGLAGVNGTGNIATKMADERRDYTAIVLPFGLFQVANADVFNVDSTEFDPVRAIEYLASPIHFIVGRATSSSAQTRFVTDLRNATLNRDLRTYQGFAPASELLAEGLSAPRFGHTFWLSQDRGGRVHGVYVGAGPYLSIRSDGRFDEGLTRVLDTGTNTPNAQFPVTNAALGQIAMVVTGGYRGRYPLPNLGSGAPGNGLFIAVNYDYLHGFDYENDDMAIRLVTDNAGLISNGSSILIAHRHAGTGHGLALDAGTEVVVDRWEMGFGVNGIANRINWSGIEQTTYALQNVLSGGDFLEGPTVDVPDARVELPVDSRGHVKYYADRWSATVGGGHGFGGASFHGGLEHRFNRFEVRGGARYTFKKWNPAAGVGFDLNPHFSFDVAAYATNTNIELKRQLAIAASFRINHLPK